MSHFTICCAGTPEAQGKADYVSSIVAEINHRKGFTAGMSQVLARAFGALSKRRAALHQVGATACLGVEGVRPREGGGGLTGLKCNKAVGSESHPGVHWMAYQINKNCRCHAISTTAVIMTHDLGSYYWPDCTGAGYC